MREGQSLIEIMIAVAVGAILVSGAFFIITPTTKTGADTVRLQIAAGLGKELLDNSRTMSEGNWSALSSLATSSVNKYYILASSSPFTATSGIQSVNVATTTYTRYFYLEDVYRNGSNQISLTGTTPDPSTKKIIVVYGWASTTASSTAYLTRTHNFVLTQTDWSGGVQDGPFSAMGETFKFSSSTNLSSTSSAGSLVIEGF